MSFPTRLRKAALKDEEFMEDYYKAENPRLPKFFWEYSTEISFCSMYVGWMMGKKGPIEANLIYQGIKDG